MTHLEGQCRHCYADLFADGTCTWEDCFSNRPANSMVLQKNYDGTFYFWGNCSPGFLGLTSYEHEIEAVTDARKADYPVYYEGRMIVRGKNAQS